MRELHPTIWLVPASMLAVAVLPLPYGYYELLRVVVFFCAAIVSWSFFEANGRSVNQGAAIFGGIAVLMNPFLIVALPKLVWVPIDLAVCMAFLVYYSKSKHTGA